MGMPKRPKRLKDADMVTPKVTLSVEMDDVTIEDFAEHFQRDFRKYMRPTGTLGATVWGDGQISPTNPLNSLQKKLEMSAEELGIVNVRIRPEIEGRTLRNYIVFKDGLELSGHLFSLKVIKSFQNRLELSIVEDTTVPIYAPKLLAWLEVRWGKKGERWTVIGAQPEAHREMVAKADTLSSTSGDEPMPLLKTRARQDDWFAWFDWYYRQRWGVPIKDRLTHMAQLNAKSHSQNASMHALYMEGKPGLPQ